jgi:hypothetical protein
MRFVCCERCGCEFKAYLGHCAKRKGRWGIVELVAICPNSWCFHEVVVDQKCGHINPKDVYSDVQDDAAVLIR